MHSNAYTYNTAKHLEYVQADAFLTFWPRPMVQDHNGPGPLGPYGPGLFIILEKIF